jgi:chromosome segregation ATPase
MNNRTGVVVLLLVALGLAVALIVIKKQAVEQHGQDVDKNVALSNTLVKTTEEWDKQKQVNSELENDREKQRRAFDDLTNNFTKVTATLSDTASNLSQTAAALKTSQEETALRDARIADLEAQNQALDRQALNLGTAITNLTLQIAETKRKLAASEGEKGFLEGELKRLMAEKADLERQFNDLTVLRAQVAKLKDELNIARRLDWIRRGLFASSDEKGATKLMRGVTPIPPKTVSTNYDLNVELHSGGGIKVNPPATNAPANPPSQ